MDHALETRPQRLRHRLRRTPVRRPKVAIRQRRTHRSFDSPAIDRYLSAFENGTLDELICGRRITELQTQLDRLTAQQTELGEAEDLQPPDEAAIRRLRQSLSDILRNGTLGQRKAVMETHIAEIG